MIHSMIHSKITLMINLKFNHIIHYNLIYFLNLNPNVHGVYFNLLCHIKCL